MGSPSHLPPPGGDFTQHQPGGQQPWSQQPLPPAKKGGGVWLWMIGGCLGILLISGIGIAALGYFGVKKFQETTGLSSEELKERPAFAAAKLITAFNPEIELVDADETTQRITIREKRTGKTVSVTLDELKEGRIRFEDSEGEEMTMSIAGEGQDGSIRIETGDGKEVFSAQSGTSVSGNDFPSWVPVPRGEFSSRHRMTSDGMRMYTAKLVSPLSAEEFADWFEREAQANGLQVKSRTVSVSGGATVIALHASSEDDQRTLQTAGSQRAGGAVEVVFTAMEKD